MEKKDKTPRLPIPIPDFLQLGKKFDTRLRRRKKIKHKSAYEAFCRWAALPQEVRKPATQSEFERIWKLPKGYISVKWKVREDFQAKRLKHFWNWMFDKFPDVVYSIYKRAVRNSSADARVFVEIIGKKLETDRPKSPVSPFFMIGVPQEKLDALFTPKEYDKAAEETINFYKKNEKVENAEIIDVEKV